MTVVIGEAYEPGCSIKSVIDEKPRFTITDWHATQHDYITNYHIDAIKINDAVVDLAILIGLKSYQIFFDSNLVVVDFVSDCDSFVSPEMLKTMFPKIETQKILKKCVFSKEIESTLSNCIVKKSRDNRSEPKYAKIL
jgi:hypothetical protein